jgi:hypothetical protein
MIRKEMVWCVLMNYHTIKVEKLGEKHKNLDRTANLRADIRADIMIYR